MHSDHRDILDWSTVLPRWLLVFSYLRHGAWLDGVFAIHGFMLLGTVRSFTDFVCIVRSRDSFPSACLWFVFGRSSRGWLYGVHSLCFLLWVPLVVSLDEALDFLAFVLVFVSCERRSLARLAFSFPFSFLRPGVPVQCTSCDGFGYRASCFLQAFFPQFRGRIALYFDVRCESHAIHSFQSFRS